MILPRPKFLDKAGRKIKLLQRRLRNKNKGSNTWQKLQHRIALLHEAVANRRKDYHFKLAHQLCDGVGSKTAWINCGRCARGQTAQSWRSVRDFGLDKSLYGNPSLSARGGSILGFKPFHA
ncbi:transposase [Spirulina subsalsa]|uniref:transposase n=1 Tax=Spirulina subsalsa TaxID=54311 RepID=UPI000310D73E|nr:transposase [Spirulina subsalsa]